MSTDSRRAKRQSSGWRTALTALSIVGLLLLVAAWLAPWARVGDVRVEGSRIEQGPPPKPGETARRVVVTFSTARDLALYRQKIGISFINASLFSCDDSATSVEEVVTQHGGALTDRHRVQALDPVSADGEKRHRYRVSFDDALFVRDGSRSSTRPAVGVAGGLCFGLDGASMSAGKLWSNTIRLDPATS